MGVLSVPPLARDARRRLVDFPTVVFTAAAEAVGGEAGALALLHPPLGCEGGRRGEELAGRLSGPHRGEPG